MTKKIPLVFSRAVRHRVHSVASSNNTAGKRGGEGALGHFLKADIVHRGKKNGSTVALTLHVFFVCVQTMSSVLCGCCGVRVRRGGPDNPDEDEDEEKILIVEVRRGLNKERGGGPRQTSLWCITDMARTTFTVAATDRTWRTGQHAPQRQRRHRLDWPDWWGCCVVNGGW